MEKLTKSGAVSQKDINELLELSNENQFGANDAYYKLQEYEDLEDQGRLLRLPCKVGDTVYCIGEGTISDYIVDSFTLDKDDGLCLQICKRKKDGWITVTLTHGVEVSKIGKTIFLTKEDAEEKLKELWKEYGEK